MSWLGALASFVRPSAIVKKYEDRRRLAIATLALSVAAAGRSASWLLNVRAGCWSHLQVDSELARTPRYAPELDALVYIPEAIPQIPAHPQRAVDLFEPVSPLWILPLPTVLIPGGVNCTDVNPRKNYSRSTRPPGRRARKPDG